MHYKRTFTNTHVARATETSALAKSVSGLFPFTLSYVPLYPSRSSTMRTANFDLNVKKMFNVPRGGGIGSAPPR